MASRRGPKPLWKTDTRGERTCYINVLTFNSIWYVSSKRASKKPDSWTTIMGRTNDGLLINSGLYETQ